jgi:hypothetical protein
MYKLHNSRITGQLNGIIRLTDNAFIPLDSENSDYQAYLKFLADGGTPLPAESN